MTTLILLLAAYGVTFGLMNDKIQGATDLLKRIPLLRGEDDQTLFARMFACAYCTGFHAGWMVWCMAVLPEHLIAGTVAPSLLGSVLPFAFASRAFCYGADTVIQWFER